MDSKLFAYILILYCFLPPGIGIFLKLTNLKCTEFDPQFAVFKECYLKLKNRNTVEMNLYVKLFQIPVTNIWVNFQNLSCILLDIKLLNVSKRLFQTIFFFTVKFRTSQKGKWLQTLFI